MDEIKAKQQVVEKIKESSKILVTVSNSPSVDALSAALGLTMVLDKQEKYATSIFSGETPPAIAFLEPEKTFDDTTDSLRDFIIALNKEKADHLRYKVDGDSVKIFITPYKTTIDQTDLEFSQGDYNVELVIALGVDNQEHLDKALEGHGQILHDAAIVTITAGEQSSDLGGIDWHDANASSLSEMISGLAEALKEDKKKSLLDQSIATALLTGIVAETDRFSNEHTTSRSMTIAAALMSAGADQQLIANELQASHAIPGGGQADEAESEGDPQETDSDVEIDQDSGDGSLTITKHDPSSLAITHDEESLAELDRRVMGDQKAKEKVTEEVAMLQEDAAEQESKDEQPTADPIQNEAVDKALEEAQKAADAPREERFSDTSATPQAEPEMIAVTPSDDEPTLGGTLNATTEQAADDARREEESSRNHTLLSHAYIDSGDDAPGETPQVETLQDQSAQLNQPSGFPGTPPVVPGSQGVNDFSGAVADAVHSSYSAEPAPYDDGAAMGISGERVIQPIEPTADTANAVAAANTAYAPEPAPLGAAPTDFGLPLPPPIPDFSQMSSTAPGMPLPPPAIQLPPLQQQPEILGDIFAPEPFAPVDTTNAVAAENTAYAPEPLGPVMPAPVEQQFTPQPQVEPQMQPASNDPGQFQIPPQQ